MGYKLKAGEKFSRGIRRIEKNQIERIVAELAEERPDRQARAIHEVRKELKKARSALRLIRQTIDARDYRKANCNFRKVGQALSQRRDAEVVLNTLDKLRASHCDRRTNVLLATLREILLRRHEKIFRQPPPTEEVRSELKAARRHIKHWRLSGLKWVDLGCGIGRIYEQGLKAFQEAERTRAPENLHEWRKRVKDLWYQLRILKPSRPAPIARLAREIKRLSEYLGDDHDLTLLEQAARNAKLGKEQMKLLSNLVDSQRAKLEQAAFELGHRLYAEKPVEFARRIERFGKKWNGG